MHFIEGTDSTFGPLFASREVFDMEHIAAVLLIVGCSGNLDTCRELPAPVPLYETSEDCQAARDPSVRLFAGADEKVFATCVPVDPAMEEEDAELVWDIQNDQLVASIEVPDVMVATNSRVTGDRSVTHQ